MKLHDLLEATLVRNDLSESLEEWFAGSKVVDAAGKPLRCYHGSQSSFEQFSKDVLGTNTGASTTALGFFFTDSPNVASRFAKGEGGQVYPVYLRMLKPFLIEPGLLDYDMKKTSYEMRYTDRAPMRRHYKDGKDPFQQLHDLMKMLDPTGQHGFDLFRQRLISKGFDGIIVRETYMDQHRGVLGGMHDFYIVFEPSQIRNVFDPHLTESTTTKFWIDSNTGTVEHFDGDQHHENELPGDGDLNFNQAIAAGWVRGGLTPGRTARMYLMGRDEKTTRSALGRIQKLYAAHIYSLEWHSPTRSFHSLGPRQARLFVKTGALPVQNSMEESLSEAQHQQGTAEFKNWFNDSKVRRMPVSSRDKGPFEPTRVYHGSPGDIGNAFEPGHQGTTSTTFGQVKVARHGFYFAEDPEFASSFATQGDRKGWHGGNVSPVYLSVQNPLWIEPHGVDEEDAQKLIAAGVSERWVHNYLGDPRSTWEAFDGEDGAWFVSILKQCGFDGIRMHENDFNLGKDFVVWIAFEPNQIKSAVGNKGTFDPNSPGLTEAFNPFKAKPGLLTDPEESSAQGIGYWFNPKTNAFAVVPWNYAGDDNETHHADVIMRHPEKLGITRAWLRKAMDHWGDFGTDEGIVVGLAAGWVRISVGRYDGQYRVSMDANDKTAARLALKWVLTHHPEINVAEVFINPCRFDKKEFVVGGKSEPGITLKGNQIAQYIRTGGFRKMVESYHPDDTAPEQGEFRSDRWAQQHDALLLAALRRWVGSPEDARLHIADLLKNPSLDAPSGSGKRFRAEAAALLWELKNRSKTNSMILYRGAGEFIHGGVMSWSDSSRVAKGFAAQNAGRLHQAAPGTLTGIRIADYLDDSRGEQEWIIIRNSMYEGFVTQREAKIAAPLGEAYITFEEARTAAARHVAISPSRGEFQAMQSVPGTYGQFRAILGPSGISVWSAGSATHAEQIRGGLRGIPLWFEVRGDKALIHVIGRNAARWESTVLSNPWWHSVGLTPVLIRNEDTLMENYYELRGWVLPDGEELFDEFPHELLAADYFGEPPDLDDSANEGRAFDEGWLKVAADNYHFAVIYEKPPTKQQWAVLRDLIKDNDSNQYQIGSNMGLSKAEALRFCGANRASKSISEALSLDTVLVEDEKFIHWTNPTPNQLIGALNRCHELRGCITKQSVFVWPAELGTHGDGVEALFQLGALDFNDKAQYFYFSKTSTCQGDRLWSADLEPLGPVWLAISNTFNDLFATNPAWNLLVDGLKRKRARPKTMSEALALDQLKA